MINALEPRLELLVKIGSIIVHVDELLSPGGHPFDKIVSEQLINDAEVQQWIKQMGPLLPVKR